MINHFLSIGNIVKGLLVGFLTIIMIKITSPISLHLIGLFDNGTMMKYAVILAYWLVIIFVTWILLWIMLFKPNMEAKQ